MIAEVHTLEEIKILLLRPCLIPRASPGDEAKPAKLVMLEEHVKAEDTTGKAGSWLTGDARGVSFASVRNLNQCGGAWSNQNR